MSLLTTWGYTVEDASELGDMLSLQEFDELTAGKYGEDERIEPDIKAASSAIRNYCGWHVYPSYVCELDTTFFDRRVTRISNNVLIQLPAKYVPSVLSVMIGGETCNKFVLDTNGLLKVYDVCADYEYTAVNVRYAAGLPEGMMDGIKELIAHRVTHALASSAGIQSETAGGVSITYSANWTNSARATALADDNKEVLAPYKVQGVF